MCVTIKLGRNRDCAQAQAAALQRSQLLRALASSIVCIQSIEPPPDHSSVIGGDVPPRAPT